MNIEIKKQNLIEILQSAESLLVAYSGGVDSSLLACYARAVLAERAKIVIAVSPSLAQDELNAARQQAEQFAWDLIEIKTNEVEQEEYARNDAMRCYFCKFTLFRDLQALAERWGIRSIAYGANLNDLSDFRPGDQAAQEWHVLRPLQEAGLTKEEIRELARLAGLPSWNRPQSACLSSRFPTFVPVSIEALAKVDQAEQFVRDLGFKQVRVRHHLDLARIEVDKCEIQRFANEPELFEAIQFKLKSLGYQDIVIDPEGYRQGSVNVVVRK